MLQECSLESQAWCGFRDVSGGVTCLSVESCNAERKVNFKSLITICRLFPINLLPLISVRSTPTHRISPTLRVVHFKESVVLNFYLIPFFKSNLWFKFFECLPGYFIRHHPKKLENMILCSNTSYCLIIAESLKVIFYDMKIETIAQLYLLGQGIYSNKFGFIHLFTGVSEPDRTI